MSQPLDQRSPWMGINPAADSTEWARLLCRAHSLALRSGRAPAVMRSLVASSWDRATAAKVDPDGRAPRVIDDSAALRAFSRSPISTILPGVEQVLAEATKRAQGFAALSDAEGLLLWVDGSPRGLEAAASAGFAPGHLASETAVGTNAVGTAIAIDDPVEIFSAEHFSRRLHGLACVATPIRDPDSRRTIAVLDLSAGFGAMHPHSLSLVTAVAMTVEAHLAAETRRRDDRRRAHYLELVARGGYDRSALISESGRVLAAAPRGWLGEKVKLGADGAPILPEGAEVAEQTVGGALLVRPAKRQRRPRIERIQLEPTGFGRVRVTIGAWSHELSRRRSEILILLALNPEGLGGEELRLMLSGRVPQPVTLRAEIFRLRKLLGPVIAASPYRIAAEVDADPTALAAVLKQGATSAIG